MWWACRGDAEALGLDRSTRRSRLLAAVAVGAVVLAVAALAAIAGALALARGGGGVAASGGVLARIDPASNAVVAGYPLSACPGSRRPRATTSVWVGDFRDGSLWRLDPASGDLERFTTTGEPRDLATTGGDVYVASDGETLLDGTIASLRQRDRRSARRASSFSPARSPRPRALVWVAGCPFIQRLSTDSGRLRVVREVEMPWREPRSAETDRSAFRDMAIGEGALWVLSDPVGSAVSSGSTSARARSSPRRCCRSRRGRSRPARAGVWITRADRRRRRADRSGDERV